MREGALGTLGGNFVFVVEIEAFTVGAAVGDGGGHFRQRFARGSVLVIPGDDAGDSAHAFKRRMGMAQLQYRWWAMPPYELSASCVTNMGMMRVVVASTNPVKIRAAEGGFGKMFAGQAFKFEGIAAESGVGHQPMSDEETLRGARNRAAHARELRDDADYWIGLEGGVYEREGTLEAFAWIVVLSRTMRGEARTATFELPPKVAELVHQGVELGHADDQVFGRTNSKQTNGAVGLLMRDLITRATYYEHAVVLALI